MEKTLLAGDIGGTKTILRLVKAQSTSGISQPSELTTLYEQTYPSQDFPDLVPMVQQFFQAAATSLQTSDLTIAKACFGIAGPVVNNTSELTNIKWFLTSDRLEKELHISQVSLINDFASIGYGILGLSSEDLYTLQKGENDPHAPKAVLGAGTGLGECFLIPLEEGNYQVFSTEGAHGDFAPRSALEFELLEYIKIKNNLDRVSIERVVSGQGIVSIYQFLREKYPEQESSSFREIYQAWQEHSAFDLASEISQLALLQQNSLCQQTLKIFIEAYGAEAGNLALKLLPYGGLYIAGGIAAKNLSLMQQGDFIKAFKAKGRMSSLLDRISVEIILNPKVGLIGAALYAAK